MSERIGEFQPPDEPHVDEREHVESADCWCAPRLDYVCPETGVAVWIHYEAN